MSLTETESPITHRTGNIFAIDLLVQMRCLMTHLNIVIKLLYNNWVLSCIFF